MTQTFSAENTMPSIIKLIEEATAFLKANGVSSRSLFVGELALEEILTNTVKYGFDGEGQHSLEVAAEVDEGRVTLQIRDDGHPFDPLRAPPPQFGVPVKTQRMGGRGIFLVRTLVERCEHRRDEGWNVLTLSFPARAGQATSK